ncbi:MAG: hypothetical protein KGS72_25565 [Cyanobacteria bacterium REEB67]|nr:hypothetical protein [Cyanobacteria bacterium REEB67]
MTDAIHNQQTAAPVENPLQSLYNNVIHGLDKLTGPSETATRENAAPLQLMPEIHGRPNFVQTKDAAHPQNRAGGKAASGDKHASTAGAHLPATSLTDSHVPVPTPRPHDLQPPKPKIDGQKVLADKTLHAIARTDLSNYGRPSQEAQDVVRGFLAEKAQLAPKDKGEALKHFAPGFNLAIRNADGEYVKAEKETAPAIKAAKEGYVQANSLYNYDFDNTIDLAKSLPEGQDKEKMTNLLKKVGEEGYEMPKKDDLVRAFHGNPQVLDSLLQLVESQKSVLGAVNNLENATKPLINAALEQDRARLAYERAAQSVGNKDLARSIDVERGLLDERTRDLIAPPTELRKLREA